MIQYVLVQHHRRKLTFHITFTMDVMDMLEDDIVYYDNSLRGGKLNGASIDQFLNSMEEWCKTTVCGRRTAWDMFAFRTKKEMAMFALRWT